MPVGVWNVILHRSTEKWVKIRCHYFTDQTKANKIDRQREHSRTHFLTFSTTHNLIFFPHNAVRNAYVKESQEQCGIILSSLEDTWDNGHLLHKVSSDAHNCSGHRAQKSLALPQMKWDSAGHHWWWPRARVHSDVIILEALQHQEKVGIVVAGQTLHHEKDHALPQQPAREFTGICA